MGPREGRDAESIFGERGKGHPELKMIQIDDVYSK
jgi:hypothetical protein